MKKTNSKHLKFAKFILAKESLEEIHGGIGRDCHCTSFDKVAYCCTGSGWLSYTAKPPVSIY